ncbi:MAG: glycosyl hydrolase, partial [Polyangiaceae bacterium]|nr:glycosyl hydrolase [Polyangiaceae bacterium]
MRRALAAVSLSLVAVVASCASGDEDAPPGGKSQGSNQVGQAGRGASGGVPGGAGAAGSAGGAGGAHAAGTSAAGAGGASAGAGGAGAGGASAGAGGASAGAGAGGGGVTMCPVTFRYQGTGVVKVAGEWSGFDLASATTLSPAGGAQEATMSLPPGLHAYKLVVDGAWQLDPAEGRRKYVGGVENSAIKVRDCKKPALRPASAEASATGFTAALTYVDAADASGADGAGLQATLTRDGLAVPLDPAAVTVAPSGDVAVAIKGLSPGKYRLSLAPRTKSGRAGELTWLPFWVEDEAFDWRDALIYMVMTDRYRDGDPSNDAPTTPGADPRGDFQGGDLAGVTQAIEDGTLDALGVRALWLTPFNENPKGAYPASDGVHQVTGYHGYWPVKARAVDPRIGGDAALLALTKAAHARGIRVLMDFVVNHVHEAHEYRQAHPGWFRTGCVCGTPGCDWTERALDCMFAPYLPDVDHTVPEANAQLVADAVYMLDRFDLDGLRVDAVKHVEEIATRNLAAEVREAFEGGGAKVFMMGETAMGWSDCPDPCNDDNYGTISRYIGPQGLDGQFDFVLYHGVSYRTFAYQEKGMLHADYWVKHGLSRWPAGAIMTPYIGSHDTARFVTLADPASSQKAGNQWSDWAGPPAPGTAYTRARLALGWLLGLPGAPLLYYGDEHGDWGGVDPNNRGFMRAEASLSPDEHTTLAVTRKLGRARRELVALRRGAYVSLSASEDTLVFGRKAGAAAAIVALTRKAGGDSITVDASGLFSPGPLVDRVGGPSASVG